MNRIIIPGPPGTGKTHRLMEYLDKELKTTDPKNILYLAFSRAAVRAAKERAPESVRAVSYTHLRAHET